ncbi:MAG TPA: hypothetical protein VFK47_06090, partial [Ktedonobacteraceae bacterium]|nr:hypothetical protein [Ktedonobacteraceae bacterium]
MLLCDGLDEVDAHYRATVSAELAELLLITQNRFVITCREADYMEQQDIVKLVNEGHIERALIRPLQLEKVREFIEQYIEDQPGGWQHTAGQIMQLIEYNRLRSLCTNPFILFTLLEIIDTVGIERGKELDTRGLLLQEYAAQLLERAQKQPAWKKGAPAESEIVHVLSSIACAARWSGDPYALNISVSVRWERTDEAVAEGLVAWLNECAPRGLLDGTPLQFTYDLKALANILDYAQDAGLIELSSQGILSFRHALFADYWVAEYFLNNAANEQTSSPSLASDFLTHVEYWSNIIALWAGLVDNPIQLAEWFFKMGRVRGKSVTSSTGKITVPVDVSSPSFLQMVILSMICMGVTWKPPRADVQRESVLPASLATMLANVMRNQASRDELAHLFTRCAEEGVQEMYSALIPLLTVEGIEEFLVLLDMTVVLALLFTYLCDAVDLPAFEAQVKRLCRILWQFGEEAVPYAAQLSQPEPNRSLRLQTAAINILG